MDSKTTKSPIQVVKSNALIEASYRLTPAEQGIILSCIAKIGKNDEVTDKTLYIVSVADYMAISGASPKSAYRDIKSAALRLRTREVRIPYLPNGAGKIQNKNGTLVTGWVQSVFYSDKEAEVSLRFNHDMLPYISRISKCFTKFDLNGVAKMTSSYGIRLYELLVQYLANGTREFPVERLCTILMAEGKYPRMYDLKKRVFEPAVNDINKHADIWVTWNHKKTGRKVTHLIFEFGLKNKHKANKKNQVNLSGSKIFGVDKAIIEKKAKTGETYEQAALRIKRESTKNFA